MNVKAFFGIILMIVGGLTALLSGGCIVIFAGSEIWNQLERGNMNRAGETFASAALFGGIPFIIGLLFFRWGRWLTRPAGSLAQKAGSLERKTPPSSVSSRLGDELGYAFREMRDEFAAFVPGLVRKEGKPSSQDDDVGDGKKDEP